MALYQTPNRRAGPPPSKSFQDGSPPGCERWGWRAPPFARCLRTWWYHESHWTKQHGETVLHGQLYPAPSSLANNFSLLAATFDALGRTGAYSAETQTGNPTNCKVVSEYKEGYARKLGALGYATTSATHLKVEKLEQLVATTSKQQAQARATLNWENRAAVVEYLLLERDLLATCALWESCLRGHDLGRLTKRCVQDRQGVSLFPQLVEDGYIITPGLRYQVAHNGTKTVQRRRAGVVLLEAKPAGKEDMCFLRRLQRFQQGVLARWHQ